MSQRGGEERRRGGIEYSRKNYADDGCDDGEQTHGIVSPLRKLTLVLIIGTRTLGDSITPKMIFPLVYCTFVDMIVMIILLNLGQIIIIRIILEIINDAG